MAHCCFDKPKAMARDLSEPNVQPVESILREHELSLPESICGLAGGKNLGVVAEQTVAKICPSNETTLYDLYENTAEEVDLAVRSARHVVDNSDWPKLSHGQRRSFILRIHDVLEKHQQELAVIQALEIGLPISSLHAMHMPRTLENFLFFSEAAGTHGGETFMQTGSHLSIVTHEPVGVVAILSPWNAPLVLCSMKLAAALNFGNAVVLKPSEHCPYSVRRFVEILQEADLPPGVINLVNGRGAVTGDALVRHPGVDCIGFIGGTETGKAIMSGAAQGLKKVGMELGGKSANIITGTADLEDAIDGSLLAFLSGNGSQCLAGSRILVQHDIAEEFEARLVERMQCVRVGDPFDPATEVGPMAFHDHYEKVLSYAQVAQNEGGQILAGGKRAAGFAQGYFLEPTLAKVTDNTARVCQEEIFGPFATLQVFDHVDEAVAIANQSDFGLVSYLWCNDLPTVTRLAQQIQAGTVWVNTPLARDLRAPFGGYKQSGVGRDGLRASIELVTEEKTTMIPSGPMNLPKLGMP